ncbi:MULTISPECIES: SRPBCC family protein [Ensifer]|uniref:SRPBCC family protein n=1 Tax=Ensifer TaxID=106591 RepID=UPI00070FDE60|nr:MULTISPECIES: SRPBCC family protein [Ensifer]KQU81263.1 ATPase [Ensifer sp. Root31]KQY65183.1 ATPase [Ensifer sp. Root142]NOV21060.1 SRPBCC family protein [Ensifer canadensis]OMQ32716.1 ATPase [Ensifer sp. 1H6]PSS61717.1 ATPase [Ensifer sp. NM-2]
MTPQAGMDDGGYARIVAPDAARIERLLPGPIERIWAYLTEEDKRRQWMASGTIGAIAESTVEHIFRHEDLGTDCGEPPTKYAALAGESRIHGRIIACKPPYLLAYTWGEGTPTPSQVRFDLEAKGSEVLLVVTHSRIATQEMMASVAAGWHTHLDILADVVSDRTSHGFWNKHTRLEQEYARQIAAR